MSVNKPINFSDILSTKCQIMLCTSVFLVYPPSARIYANTLKTDSQLLQVVKKNQANKKRIFRHN